LTKEPKLDRARRILPEWEGFDNEITAVREMFLAKAGTEEKETHDEL
jgi:UDP-glucose:glycoprotein glucosyltransferase